MERNIRMWIAYDGTDFHGWQRQPQLRTVQDLVEQAIRRVVRHQIMLNGADGTGSTSGVLRDDSPARAVARFIAAARRGFDDHKKRGDQ